jgi:hypothetical protein
MRRKPVQFRRLRNGVWKQRGEWTPVYVLDQQRATGDEYQHYAVDADGKVVYAGVTRHEHVGQAQANQIHRVWRRWRREYDGVFDGVGREYPARHCQPVVRIVIHPIGNPNTQQSFCV